MAAPTIGVCGYGRCGSTMVMTMLTAGGVPAVAGSQTGSFEVADYEALMALAPDDLAGRCVAAALTVTAWHVHRTGQQ